MKKLRAAYSICTLLAVLAFYPKELFAETVHAYDDAWWEAQYERIYDTPKCREIISNTEKIKEADRKVGLLIAPQVWAIGMYFAKGECGDPAPDEALEILTDLAERGQGIAAVFLAQLYHINHGANAPLTQSWVERAKHAMPLIITKDWRKDFYQPLADGFQKAGTSLSPQLERIFSWGEETLGGEAEPLYQIGIRLIEQGANPGDKVLGCRWLYAAEKKGHHQARFRIAQLHIRGEGIIQAPGTASPWLYMSVNNDNSVKALLFLSQLLERGAVFKKDLPESYAALLKAEHLGANVKSELMRLNPKLSHKQLKSARWRLTLPNYKLSFQVHDPDKYQERSLIISHICRFVP
ncbi:MAG: hypothetical protein JKY27_02615 [Magnetovibrio sp.]|nr:hypothetical protein [Magnetovibrio sp.]